jgi:hypothetical protein
MTTIQGKGGIAIVQTTTSEPPGASDASQSLLLPSPLPTTLGDDSMTALAMLLTRADNQDRTASRTIEDQSDSAAVAQDDQRVQQMMDKADQDAAQGLESGLGDIAGGVATSVSGFLPDGASTGVQGEKDAPSTNWRSFAEGFGKVAPGAGSIASSASRAEGDQDDARAASFEASAQLALRRYDGARDEAQAADASLQKVQQFLQQYQQSENESRSAAASMLKG